MLRDQNSHENFEKEEQIGGLKISGFKTYYKQQY